MGFAWVQNIGIGVSIDSVDIVEIRDAADFVKCNLCVVDHSVENVGENGLDLTGEDGADNTGEDGVDNTSQDGTDNPAEDGLDLTGEDGTHNPAYQSPDNIGEKTPDNVLEDSAALPTNNLDQADCSGDHHPYYVAALDFEDDAAQVDHTDHNPAYAPGHVSLELGGDDSPHKTDV